MIKIAEVRSRISSMQSHEGAAIAATGSLGGAEPMTDRVKPELDDVGSQA